MSENKDMEKTPVVKWIIKNVAGIAAVFMTVVLGSALFIRINTRHGKEIRVPDLSGMSAAEASALASSKGLSVCVTDSVYIRRMGRGLVYQQNPKAGARVKEGRRILLTINSVTPKKLQMPNLVGYSMRQAKAELGSRGLLLGHLEYVGDIATNNVLGQKYRGAEIRPGTMIESGSRIDLVVGLSEDDNLTYIPDLKGLRYLMAVDAAHDCNLNIGRLVFDKGVRDYADSMDAVVYRQTPAASADAVLMGSDVTIYLKLEKKDAE